MAFISQLHLSFPNLLFALASQKACQPHLAGFSYVLLGFPGRTSVKESTCQCRRCKRHGLDPWVGKIPQKRAWQPTPTFFPGESMDRGAWWATVLRVAKSQTQRKQLSTHTFISV